MSTIEPQENDAVAIQKRFAEMQQEVGAIRERAKNEYRHEAGEQYTPMLKDIRTLLGELNVINEFWNYAEKELDDIRKCDKCDTLAVEACNCGHSRWAHVHLGKGRLGRCGNCGCKKYAKNIRSQSMIGNSWSKETPKVDGVYWWRLSENDPDPDICETDLEHGSVYDIGDPMGAKISERGGEWLGPVFPVAE